MTTSARNTMRRKIIGKKHPILREAWQRDPRSIAANNKLGRRIRQLREARGLSLGAASKATDIPAATLSRIENNKMSPTFSVLLKLMTGLNVSWNNLMHSRLSSGSDKRISVAFPQLKPTADILAYRYWLPHSSPDLSLDLQPLIIEVIARSLEEGGGLTGHPGTEFCYVLSGTLVFYVEGIAPQELEAGASVLFDAGIPHAYVRKGRTVTRILVVVRDPGIGGGAQGQPFSERRRKAKASGDHRNSTRLE